VTNMPGAVARTSTFALTNATIPYALKIADQGLETAFRADPALARGINTYGGKVTCEPVAEAAGLKFSPLVGAAPGPKKIGNRRKK